MTETDDLTALRSSVAQLDQYEKLALATFLTGTSNPKFQAMVIPEDETLGYNLGKAFELAKPFSSATKIFFAIELLELQIDRDEEEDGDELYAPIQEPDLTKAIAEINSPEADMSEEELERVKHRKGVVKHRKGVVKHRKGVDWYLTKRFIL
jgi:hypothetical protein